MEAIIEHTIHSGPAFATPDPAPAASADMAAAPAIPQTDILAALGQLLASSVFAKARRMRRLLRFLVERRMAGSAQSFKEVVIGIEVFDRDPAHYDPAEDPIVRVQMGRLRQRLESYYAQEGGRAGVVFSVPLGSYIPEIARPGPSGSATMSAGPADAGRTLSVGAVQPITADPQARCFSLGLSEELYDRMHHEFGSGVVQQDMSGATHAPRHPHLHYRLEGSVRFENDMTRASFRLLDLWNGSIAWSRQFDRQAAVSVLLQEQLALAVCSELQAHFSAGRSLPA